jgi:hypothetical protein
LTRRLACLVLAVGVSACANDYDQFSFGAGGSPKDGSVRETAAFESGMPVPDSASDDAQTDRGAATDGAVMDVADAVAEAADDHRDAASGDADASVDVVVPPEDAGADADAGVAEDAPPDVPDAGAPDVSVVDDGGDADAGTSEDASVEPDVNPDVSVGTDGSSDAPDDVATCEGGQKRCGDHCVGLDDPATGCGEPSCSPCDLPHSQARCDLRGKCAIDTCEPNFDDCDHAPENGCEASIRTDVAHCGACGRACSSAHVASKECSAGVCVSTCELGFGNCERPGTGPDDGCERAVDQDAINCGSCGNSCQDQAPGLVCGMSTPNFCGCVDNASCRVGGASGVCDSDGLCKCGPTRCRPGETCRSANGPDVCACNGGGACAASETCCDLPAGCRDLSNDPASCGACGRACPAGLVCAAGVCACAADGPCFAGSSGTCAAGKCVCNGTTCAAGQRCLPDGTCG